MSEKRPEHLDLTAKQTRSPVTHGAKIARIFNLSPTVKGFSLDIEKPSNGTLASFKAGQWVDFMIPGVDQVGGFSMTSSPTELDRSGTLDLAIKDSTWPPADWLHRKAAVGDRVRVKVGGEFHYPNQKTDAVKEHDMLLVAGGVGINPVYSIIREIMESKSPSSPNVSLLYSARTAPELIFKEEIEQYSKNGLTRKYFVTGETSGRMGKEDLREALDRLSQEGREPFCFICGPTPMIKELDGLLQELGVAKENIIYELWW